MKTKKTIWISIKLIFIGALIFSFTYTLILVGIGQLFWKNKARGYIIKYKGKKIGSKLIGQDFNSSKYFYSRPSSIGYDGTRSGSANLASNNPELKKRVLNCIRAFNRKELSLKNIPADLVTESGSGLDPHITPRGAYFQVPRISASTGISKEKLKNIIRAHIKPEVLGLFGQKHVNVLKLNMEILGVLNELKKEK